MIPTLGAWVVRGTIISVHCRSSTGFPPPRRLTCHRKPCKSASHTERCSRINAPAPEEDVVVQHEHGVLALLFGPHPPRSGEKRTNQARLHFPDCAAPAAPTSTTLWVPRFPPAKVRALWQSARAKGRGGVQRRRGGTRGGAGWSWVERTRHGSVGAHHAATRFHGAAHRLIVKL